MTHLMLILRISAPVAQSVECPLRGTLAVTGSIPGRDLPELLKIVLGGVSKMFVHCHYNFLTTKECLSLLHSCITNLRTFRHSCPVYLGPLQKVRFE